MAVTPDDLAGADVAVLGAPFDLAVTYRPGTRFGPRAVRQAEDVGVDRRPSIELGIDPYSALDVVDYGDAAAPFSDVLGAHESIRQRVGEILAAGAIPAVIGGDHSITLPILRALAAHHGAGNFSVIHFDTHADTGEIHPNEPLPDHGQPFSRAVEEGVLLGGNIVQIGLRGCWPFPAEFDRMREQGFRWHTMAQIDERGLRAVLDDAISHARERAPRTYLTVDVDSMDPAYAPGTGTPEPGGLSSRELLGAVRRISCELDLCGVDLVEVSPPYDVAGITALAGQRVIQEALGGIALRRSGGAARPARH
jgi:agmatinase